MTYLLIPIAFVVGGVAGGVITWIWRGRAEPEPVTRRQKLKLVAATALCTTLLIAAGGFAALRLGLKKTKMSKASTGDAVNDFRKSHRGGSSEAGLPPAGVYTYLTKGYLKAESKLLGDADLPLPESIPVVVTHDKSCFNLELRLFKQNHRSEKYCREGDTGFKIVERWEKNEMFGIKNFTRQTSGPHGVLGPTGAPKPGDSWKMTWKVVEETSSMPLSIARPDIHLTVTYQGLTKLDIGGKPTAAHYLKMSASYSVPMKGTLDRDIYYAADNFLMLRLHERSVASGMATMKFDRQYTVASLTPKQ